MTPGITVTKKPTSGLFVVCLLLSVAIIFFLIMPKFKAYSEAKQTAQAAKDSLEMIQNQGQELEQIYTQLNNNRGELVRVDLALPDKPDISSIYALVETFSKSSNLALTSIQASDDADVPANERPEGFVSISPTLGVITVNMQLSGTVEGFTQFLQTIEQSLRFIDVQSVDISSGDEDNALTFRSVFKTYYQK